MTDFQSASCDGKTTMIEEVHFENFKCLSDVRCSLAQWTVFVGPNASG